MNVKEPATSIQHFTIVVIGNFNPAILHPEWFDRNQILPPQEVREVAESTVKEPKNLKGVKIKYIGTNFSSCSTTC